MMYPVDMKFWENFLTFLWEIFKNYDRTIRWITRSLQGVQDLKREIEEFERQKNKELENIRELKDQEMKKIK